MTVQNVTASRPQLLRHGSRLEVATVGWNLVEGIVGVSAGILASSVALVGFGLDSFVETTSGAIVWWRLRAELSSESEPERAEAIEHRASRIAGSLLLTLAAYILAGGEHRSNYYNCLVLRRRL
jgi:hypothetical protein